MGYVDPKDKVYRCHHCANAGCQYKGHRRTEVGCPDFIFLEPALRLHKWQNPDGTLTRRIRAPLTVRFPPENIDFIKDYVLPSNKRKYQGYFTRGLDAIVARGLKGFEDAGEIPVVPKIDREEGYSRQDRGITLEPKINEKLVAIVDHWKGTPNECSRGSLINYMIDLARDELFERMEQQKRGGGQ